MGFSRQEYWSGLPFLTPGDLPNPGTEPRSPTLQVGSLPAEPQGKPKNTGMGSLSLLQRIFQAQESNWGLLHCRWILLKLSYEGSICQQIWKTQQWPQDWKRSLFIPIPKISNAKECSNYHTTALISHASKVMLKILQVRLQQYMNHELPDILAGFRKAEGPEIKLPTSAGSSKKQESSRKTSALLTTPKPLTVWITNNCGKFFKRRKYQTT